MKIGWVLWFGLVTAMTAQGQSFQKKFKLKIDEPLSHVEVEWMALDRDTLLDVVVTGIAADGQLKLITYQNNLGTSLVKKTTQLTGFKEGTFQLADWNSDNRLDLVMAGKTLINTDALFVFENKGDFTFQKSPDKLLEHHSLFRLVDLNQDGRLDVITAGQQNNAPFLRVYQNDPAGMFLKYDTLGIAIEDLLVFDFDKDSRNDWALSGSALQNPKTLVFLNRGSFTFEVQEPEQSISGKLSAIDYNEDGYFDLFAAGTGSAGQPFSRIWLNKIDSFTVAQTNPAPFNARLFTGDMNSDGRADRLLHGLNDQGHKINYLLDSLETTALDTTGLTNQRMGDFDRDGDLDLLQAIDSADQQWLKIYENTTVARNKRPGVPATSFAISAFNKTFLYWESPDDDHTATASLTYDVWLGTDQKSLIAPSFDLSTGRRMTVSHGNAGTNTSQIIRGLTDNRYYYLIQSVDNAYNGSYGFCSGGVLPCFDLVHENVQACKNEEVTLATPAPAYWFSTAQGFLGIHSQLKFTAIANDTLFSFVPQGLDCSKNKAWLVYVNDESKSEIETIYACQDQSIRLGIAPGWKDVVWEITPRVVNTDSINFLVTKAETVIVTASTQTGCTYEKEFVLKISRPELKLNGEVFQIMRGSSVQLEAISSATLFLWEPATGLSDPASANPLATPTETTDYTVTATDSVGCTVEGKVQIQVEETAFVPNLFTPNDDGKNDALLVYGLTQADSFTFQIFNREGNLVYESNDIRQATSSGWDGTVRGTQQPSGVYYWKVKGTSLTGKPLLLNGKKTGSILLVH
jgi:gliding motility-associated-like protein